MNRTSSNTTRSGLVAALPHPAAKRMKAASGGPLMAAQFSPQMMFLLNRVIDENNQGVEFYERQEYINAFRCFRQALVLFKTRFQEQESAAPVVLASQRRNEHGSIRPLSCSAARTALGEWSSPPEEEEASGCFVLHTQCFRLLPGLPGLLSSDPLQEDRLVSAILVFNCGLVFHRQGQATCSVAHMQKAYALYQQAFTLLEDQIHAYTRPACHQEATTGNALVDFLCMAILNNMGLILRCDFLDHMQSKRIFGLLVACAHAFQSAYSTCALPENEEDSANAANKKARTGDISSTTPSPDEQESALYLLSQVDEFLLNAVALNCSDSRSAPAA